MQGPGLLRPLGSPNPPLKLSLQETEALALEAAKTTNAATTSINRFIPFSLGPLRAVSLFVFRSGSRRLSPHKPKQR